MMKEKVKLPTSPRPSATRFLLLCTALLATLLPPVQAQELPPPDIQPLQRIIDLSEGESARVELHDGSEATIRLLAIDDERDPMQNAVRRATATVEVNGEEVTLECGNYRLPVQVGGVQIDCVITRAYYRNTTVNHWNLTGDARLRLWPSGSPWVRPGTFGYPLRQRLFASDTQAGNEPTFVDGGNRPTRTAIYYHAGFDFAGYEGKTEVIAAADGYVVSTADQSLDLEAHPPVRPRYDVIYIRDDRGWYYRYSHLKSIETPVRLGERVFLGQKLGAVGKEGHSGGYAHLHLDISVPMPSGEYGIVTAFPFLWQGYREQYDPEVVALARPHRVAYVGETVTLDGTRSWAKSEIRSYEWILSDGSTHTGPTLQTTYDHPGTYSEILKVTDVNDQVDFDFGVVQVFGTQSDVHVPPTINAVHHPTLNIKAGDPVYFAVRTFRLHPEDGEEIWDFGDGSAQERTRSNAFGREEGFGIAHHPEGYAETVHRFREPGDYIVTVHRTNSDGHTATSRLHVQVVQPKMIPLN